VITLPKSVITIAETRDHHPEISENHPETPRDHHAETGDHDPETGDHDGPLPALRPLLQRAIGAGRAEASDEQ
jgi:hypothetical protein